MGKDNYAEYTLERRMAKNSKNVYNLLNQLLEAYKPVAMQEVREVKGLPSAWKRKTLTLCLGIGLIIPIN